MISKGLFTYLAMIALAVGIAIFYIEPTFSGISKMQDDIALYQEEQKKINQVNNQLAVLVGQLEGVPSSDQNKLLTYLPDQIDTIAVSRTLQIIAQQSGVLLENVSYGKVDQKSIDEAEQSGVTDFPVPHTFSVSVQGTYRQIKTMLGLLEKNEYPLEVHELEIGVVQGNFLSVEMTVVTYSHLYPEESYFDNI